MKLLNGAIAPYEDRMAFMKAQIVFWLLAAIDGHAKNFSIFLGPGGKYAMTPLYDVMSVQPVFDAGQLQANRIRLAMAVGNGRHYRTNEIVPRHFAETAKLCGIGESIISQITDELISISPAAIEATRAAIPDDFPGQIADSIIGGYETRLMQLSDVRP